jgi:hypothetical protein
MGARRLLTFVALAPSSASTTLSLSSQRLNAVVPYVAHAGTMVMRGDEGKSKAVRAQS